MAEVEPIRSEARQQFSQLSIAASRKSAQSLWEGLGDAASAADYCSAWLSLQCSRIEGATSGLVAMCQGESDTLTVTAVWPQQNPRLAILSRLADLAHVERRVAVTRNGAHEIAGAGQASELLLATPVGIETTVAVVAIAIRRGAGMDLPAPEAIAEQLRWGGGWLTALPWARQTREANGRLVLARSCMDLLVTVGKQHRLQGMAMEIVNELASRLECDRVSLGILRRNGAIRLRAISHSSRFKNEGRLIDAIENVMEEAIDQRKTVAYPSLPSADRTVTMAHRALTEVVRAPGPLLMTVIIPDGAGRLIGAITLERHREDPFTDETMELAEVSAVLLGPVIRQQLLSSRLVAGSVVDRAGDGMAAVFGRGRPSLKLAAVCLVALGAVLPFAHGEHRVTATAVLEPQVQRAAVVPFDGFIRSASVRAGDTVHAGQILAVLDDRDLVLDQFKWRTERDKLVQKQRDALAKHERSDLVVISSQIRQAETLLALAEEKLSRSRIKAPFDGMIVSGDLSQKLGSPVSKGETLFEIAPLDSYRLVIHVGESDIRHVSVHQKGHVALAGSPGSPLPIEVSKIMPVAVVENGRNALQVEARLVDHSPGLQPGMEGVAKIEAGEQSLLWIWTHGVVEAARMAAWKYLP